MKYTVQCMYNNGTLLSNEEIAEAPSYTGCLVIQEPNGGLPLSQYSRKARLFEKALSEKPRDVISPLFAVEGFELGKGRMMVSGYQISVDSNTGTVQQHEQAWLVLSTTSK